MDLVYEVIRLYQSARQVRPAHHKVTRGRSRSISSDLEDLFALFLVNKIQCDHIYVDQPIAILEQRQPRCPDITIARDNQLTAFCDLKTDMGWDRKGLGPLCRRHYQWLHEARGKTARLNEKKGAAKTGKSYEVSKRATYSVVILHEHNVKADLLRNDISAVRKQLGPDLDVFILTRGGHPNAYNIGARELRKTIHLRHDDLRALVNRLNG